MSVLLHLQDPTGGVISLHSYPMRTGVVMAVIMVLVIGLAPAVTGQARREVTIRATVLTDASGPDRAVNLQRAVQRLNQKLTDVTIRLELEEPATEGGWTAEAQRQLRAFAAGDDTDIYALAHEFIAEFAKAGRALILDDLIKQYPETYQDFFPALWESVRFRNRIYAVPQDTEARMLYFRVDRLKQFGWSEAQIATLPGRIQRGEFTLFDMAQLAQQVKDRGIVEWGFYHRPTRGVDYYQLIMAFGGQIYDPKTSRLVLDRSATLDFLKFLNDAVYTYKITPASMTNTPWRSVHGGFGGEGKVLFWLGGIWNSAEYIKDYGVPAGDFFNRMDWGLVPASRQGGRPLTMSHPIVYAVNARSREKDLAFRIVTEASSADLNAIHAVNSFHLAVRRGVTQVAEYKNNPWLSKATSLLEYTTFIPNHEDFSKYDQVIYESIQGVETKRLTPEQALQFVETQMRSQIRNQLVVVE